MPWGGAGTGFPVGAAGLAAVGNLAFLVPSGDTSGVTDATAIMNCFNGKLIPVMTPGTYYWQAGIIKITAPGFYVWATGLDVIIKGTGTGDVFRMYSTSAYVPGGPSGGGIRGNPLIDGSACGAGSSGIHAGDIYRLQWEVSVRGFQGTGSKNIWFDNQYYFTEQMSGVVWAEEGTDNVVFDNSAVLGVNNTGSFDRLEMTIFLNCKNFGNGVTFQNGAIVIDPAWLMISGNIDSSGGVAQYAVLTVKGSNVANGFSRIANGPFSIGVEYNNNVGGNAPETMVFGTAGSNSILGCSGVWDFSGDLAMGGAVNYQEGVSFDGPIFGDNLLASGGSSGPLGLYPFKQGAISNGTLVFTKFSAITEVTTTANVTGIRLDSFPPDNWRVFWLMNNGTGTITMDVAGTSNVANGVSCVLQPNSMRGFVWNADLALWFPNQQ